MPKTLDQIVLEIQLQRKDFERGIKEIQEGYKKAADALVQSNKNIEAQSKKTADSLSGLTREAQGFLGLLAGALAGRAVSSFTQHLSSMDAALARFSQNLGANPQDISAWSQAVERMGGSAQAAQSTIQGLYDKVWRLTTLGESMTPGFWLGLQKGGVSQEFFKQQDAYDRILVVAKAIQNVNEKSGRAEAAATGRNFFGLDEGTINLILEKGPKLKDYLADIKRKTTPSPEDNEAAKRLQEAWASLSQTIDDFVRKVKTAAEPYIQSFVDGFKELVQSWDKAAIKAKIKEFGDFLLGEGGQDIKRFFLDLKAIVTGVADKINAVGEAYSAVRDSRFGRAVGAGFSGFGYAGRTIGGMAAGAYNFGARQLGYGGSESSPASEAAPSSSPANSATSTSQMSHAQRAWNFLRGHGGQSSDASGGTPDSVQSAFASRRARFAAELKRDPALREHALAISLGENQDPTSNRAVFETMMNRADMLGTSFARQARTTSQGGYYAGYQPGALRNPKLRAMAEANLDAALGGSNVSKYATDNASGAWGWGRMHGMFQMDSTYGREFFGHPMWRGAAGADRYQGWKNGMSSYENTTRTNTSTTIGAMNFNTGGTGANQFPKDVPAYFANYNYAVIHNDGAR